MNKNKKNLFRTFFASIFTLTAMQSALASPGGVSANLELWLKADAGTSTNVDGDPIAAWADQSGARVRTAQAVGGDGETRPTFKNNVIDQINFNPVVEFNGTSNGLSFFNDFIFSSGSGITLFAMTQPNNTGANKYVLDFGFVLNTGYNKGSDTVLKINFYLLKTPSLFFDGLFKKGSM